MKKKMKMKRQVVTKQAEREQVVKWPFLMQILDSLEAHTDFPTIIKMAALILTNLWVKETCS